MALVHDHDYVHDTDKLAVAVADTSVKGIEAEVETVIEVVRDIDIHDHG